jgi:hypothetical protein
MIELLQNHPGWLLVVIMLAAFVTPILELWRERNRLESDNYETWKRYTAAEKLSGE